MPFYSLFSKKIHREFKFPLEFTPVLIRSGNDDSLYFFFAIFAALG